MKRTDIVMTEMLRSFLAFDLGHMDESLFPHRRADLRYSDDPDLLLDLYYPQEPRETYPVFLLVFGGGWVSGFRRSKYVEAMLAPLRFGYACAVAQYTLALDDVFPRPISDLKRAVHFLHTHAQELHLDTSRLTLWGESAGGHLALETALLPDAALGLEGLSTAVSGLVIFYPVTDVDTLNDQARSCGFAEPPLAADSVLGLFLGPRWQDAETRRLASPVHFLRPDMPRLWLQHGDQDTLVPYLQSEELARAMKARCPAVPLHYECAPGLVHTDPWFFTDENLRRVFRFLEETP